MITVKFLGGFHISDGKSEMTEATVRSEMLVKLMIYLVMNRSHSLSIQELTGILWEDHEVDNPAGALKNLMYRLRMKLKESFGRDDFIITGRGNYAWNQDVVVTVDVEQFMNRLKRAQEKDISVEEKRLTLEECLQYYGGDFGTKCRDNYWMMTQSTFYRSMYFTAVKLLANIYLEQEAYSKLETICEHALHYDVTDEKLHELIIKSLLGQDKIELAEVQFEDANRILLETMGIRHSKILDQVGKEIHKRKKTGMLSLEQVVLDQPVEDEGKGAFGCSYHVFKEIYRLETRKIARLGMAEYLGMFTVVGNWKTDDMQQEIMSDFMASQAMDRLEQIVHNSLRSGDAYTRINEKQLIILLPGCTYENASKVVERVKKIYMEQYQKDGIMIRTDIHEIGE